MKFAIGDIVGWSDDIKVTTEGDENSFAIVFAKGSYSHRRGDYRSSPDECMTIMWEDGTIGHFMFDDENLKVIHTDVRR